MNDMGAPPSWSGTEQFDSIGAAESQDFGLLDFDNIDLDNFDFGNSDGNTTSQQLGQLAEELDVQHLHNSYSPVPARNHHNGAQQQPIEGHGMPQPGHNFFEFGMSTYNQHTPLFTQAQEQMYRPRSAVPPTPNSVEMHGDQVRYMHHMDAQQAMFDQRFQMRKDDMTFTPLVSPAVTPHEARFRVQDMTTVPGAYFSPLTSPALNAQNHAQAHAHPSQYATTSGSSTGASPVDVNMDMLEEAATSQLEDGRTLRSGSKRKPPRSSAAAARVRQSPVVKPGRRKATVTSLIPPKEVTELVEDARSNRPPSSGTDHYRSRDSSEADSISPEHLSEMGPPPKPGSVTPSPSMLAQNQQAPGQGVTPATPASLMCIQPSPTFDVPDVSPTLDDLTLPEASLERPPLSRIDTTIVDGDHDTPRLSARKTPKLAALSTPSGGSAQSGRPSPMLTAVSSPMSPAFSVGTGRKVDAKLARNPKKRNSITPNLVSPALRPKISPSIKPLLPDSSVSDDTHALLLASKSNYQNILDGTTVPGVNYPTSLSTNLTSKRTSHKIAEQGRRNRINTALQEMQDLLPAAQLSAKEGKSPESMAMQSSNSKAAKVESAIDYIKQLQQQCLDRDRVIDQKDLEMECLRQEIAAMKQGGSNTTSAKSDTSAQAPQDAKENGT